MENVLSPKAAEDLILVKIIQDKNSNNKEVQKAFEKIFSRYYDSLYYMILKMVKDKETADDLTMVSFQKCYEKIDQYNEINAFSTWLFKIAKNSAIDHLRKEKFEELSLDNLAAKTADEHEGMEFQLDGNVIDPEKQMIREENAKAIHKAIEGIPSEKIRRIMHYRYIDELSFEEIAIKEGVNKNSSTLRVNALRGQEMIKETIAALV